MFGSSQGSQDGNEDDVEMLKGSIREDDQGDNDDDENENEDQFNVPKKKGLK